MKTATNATGATILRQEPTIEENTIAEKVMDAAFIVHRELGAGFLESVYEECMFDVLNGMGLSVERQKVLPIRFRDKILSSAFRADLVVENSIIVELKAVEKLTKIHEAQILNYLKLSEIKIGFLLNFNTVLLKHGLKRFIKTN